MSKLTFNHESKTFSESLIGVNPEALINRFNDLVIKGKFENKRSKIIETLLEEFNHEELGVLMESFMMNITMSEAPSVMETQD